MLPGSTSAGIEPGCGAAATSSVPPSARIWNCSSKSPDGLDLGLVVGLRVDQVVEDLLVGVDLFGLAGAQEVHLPVFSFRPLPAPVTTAAVVVVVAAARAQCECHRDDGNDQSS